MIDIKKWIGDSVGKTGLNRLKKRSPIVKEVVDNPENLKLELYIEGDEIVVKIKKKGS